MPLEDLCAQYKGGLVFVSPVIGFGWCLVERDALSVRSADAEPPRPFHARVSEFHYFLGKIKAGSGIIEEQNHPLDKEWVAFCIRDRGKDMYDLTTKPGKYNLRIGSKKPRIKIDPENLPMPECMQFQSQCLSGLGYVAESATWIKAIAGK